MTPVAIARRLLALWCLAMTMQAAALQLTPIVAGLASPLFVTAAGDGTNRLYIVERGGIVRVLPPGASAPSMFLDVRARVIAGEERGLLGLAFHPRYAANGRLFVYYTRAGDGALIIAEHRRSAADPLLADGVETVLLTIDHPRHSNHNGGMLAFGPDGYLYVGVGDGGAGNDPSNNAQSTDVLLGKILRIDVDRADAIAGTRYAAPPDNPFVNAPGRDEIFALGLRNPWRFGFDRATGALWVGDVGQGDREEVHAPVVAGGNYGWRVYEGTRCTDNDPALCVPTNFTAPVLEYSHTQGRCSITGGYVYRGVREAVEPGAYVYGDFCSGEIFAWSGSAQVLLSGTGLAIASFGEDEEGELFVVDLAGTISRLDPDPPPSAPASFAVEYRHAGFGHYFVTSLDDEIAQLDAGVFDGWSRTGETFRVHQAGVAGQLRVCRFFSLGYAPRSSHFYTAIPRECDVVSQDPDWQLEGEVFAMQLPDFVGNCPAATVALYRVYNSGRNGAPNHRYTTSLGTRGAMLAQGWIAEGYGLGGVIGCVPG